MNDNQIRAQAETECAYLIDKEFTKIQVAAQLDNGIANNCFIILDEWAERASGKVKVMRTGSFGYDDLEPIVIIEKPDSLPVFYAHVTEDVTSQLVRDYLEGDNPRPDQALCIAGGDRVKGIPAAIELPLFKLQKRIALRNCGLVDPESINHYVAGCEGYTGLAKVLKMSQVDVVEEIRRSGLRDRGGAGYLTADKWRIVQESEEGEKVVVSNAIDNNLQARTTQLLLEGDPHSVLEGLMIAAYAVGASQCLIAVPVDKDGVKTKLLKALAQMKNYSLLGENILDSGFNCDVDIREITPSLVAGEETSLLRSLEGKQAIPYLRGKDSKALKLDCKPTLINDSETFANVSAILQRGAEWFAEIGTAGSTGTKVISLTGAVVHPYTVEVPFGTTIETVIREIAGGIPDDCPVKAVQLWGQTSAYFGADDLKKPIDYETLQAAGSLIGFGMMEVVAYNTCAVEMTEQLMAFLHSQSCGKCVFCREGTLHMSQILKDIARGEGTAKDLDLLKELGRKLSIGSICSFGQSAANPLLSSMKLFKGDYDAHIKEKRCPRRQSGKGE